jgi:bacterioferritin-associated ferredoxin
MNSEEYVCVCHRVSLGKLRSFLVRENPTVASQLSECLDAGTSCGWCIPFLEKLHKSHTAGEGVKLTVDYGQYVNSRDTYRCKKQEIKPIDD